MDVKKLLQEAYCFDYDGALDVADVDKTPAEEPEVRQ